MAPENVGVADKKRRRRKRKARTEDFSSDSDSDSSHGSTKETKEIKDDDGDVEMTEEVDDLNIESEEIKAPTVHPKTIMPEALKPESDDSAFNDYYLQLMTSEFAEDLDKLRQSKDFGDKSLYLLIEALKQGSSMFDLQEREEIIKSQK
ncbi:hypothetical protein TRVA0_013S03070 [Trichomonascus vanleenenianus]|uniref:Rsa3p n=1 Tax=Trichomonascus vanleenenianus TaxID=2268995 RepID=UPI003EC9C894